MVGKNIIVKNWGDNIYKIWTEIKNITWEDIDKMFYVISYHNEHKNTYKCYESNDVLSIVPLNYMIKLDGYSVIITTINTNYNDKKKFMDTLVGMMLGPNAIENIYDKLVYYNDVLSDNILVHFKNKIDAINFGDIAKIFTKLHGLTCMTDIKIEEGKMEMKDIYINTCTATCIIDRILHAEQYMYFITMNPNKTHEINKMIINKPIYIFTLREKPTHDTIPIFTEESNISDIHGYNGIVFSKLIDMIGLDNVVKCYNNEKCRFNSVITCYHNGYITKYEHYIDGIIVEKKGDNGFGWDPIFYYPEMKMTFGEMTTEMKNQYSPRIKTLTQFLDSFK
jgi:inosine/xanthosine triphosphate pyrophosphatase family protein